MRTRILAMLAGLLTLTGCAATANPAPATAPPPSIDPDAAAVACVDVLPAEFGLSHRPLVHDVGTATLDDGTLRVIGYLDITPGPRRHEFVCSVATVDGEITATITHTGPIALPPTTTPAPTHPDFWTRKDRDGYLTMIVDGTYTDAQLEAAFLNVRDRYSAFAAGGWFVQIDCGVGNQAVGGARQARGKFALDGLGTAQTGLPAGDYEFTPVPDRAPCDPEGA